MRDPFALVPPASQFKTTVKPPKSPSRNKNIFAFGILGLVIVVLFAFIALRFLRPVTADVLAQNYSASIKIVDLPQDKKASSGDKISTTLTISNEGKNDIDGVALIYGLGVNFDDTLKLSHDLKEDEIGYTRILTQSESEGFNEKGGSGFFLKAGALGSGQAKSFPVRLSVYGGAGSQSKIIVKLLQNTTQDVPCGALGLNRCTQKSSSQISSENFNFILSNKSKVVLKAGYNFITLPYTFSPPSSKDFLSTLKSKWAYYFKTSTAEYLDLFKSDNANYIKSGAGFWVYSENGEEFSLPDSKVETNTNDTYTIDLDIGWNYIGNPYSKRVLLSGSKILFREASDDGSASGAIYTIKSALDSQTLSTPYVPDSKSFTDSSGAQNDQAKLVEWKLLPLESVLQPFVGVIINSAKKGTLILPGKDVIAPCDLLDDGELVQIQNWISKSGLNLYGDPQGTVYSQGTPVDSAGQVKNSCDYILENHPDKPWLSSQ